VSESSSWMTRFADRPPILSDCFDARCFSLICLITCAGVQSAGYSFGSAACGSSSIAEGTAGVLPGAPKITVRRTLRTQQKMHLAMALHSTMASNTLPVINMVVRSASSLTSSSPGSGGVRGKKRQLSQPAHAPGILVHDAEGPSTVSTASQKLRHRSAFFGERISGGGGGSGGG